MKTLVELARTGNLPTALGNRLSARRARRLFPRPVPGWGGWSARRINRLHAQIPALASYLEIGLAAGRTFEHVTLPRRVGVDPRPQFDLSRLPPGVEIHVLRSDEYFASLREDATFDVVFLDGLHTYQQTYRDLIASLRVCPAGAILVDDVVPSDEVSAMPDEARSLEQRRRQGLAGYPWHGDVYRLILCLGDHHPDLEYRTIVGDGNPQTLVWKRDPAASTHPVADDALMAYAAVSFRDVFAQGVPEGFHPMTERAALAEAVTALSPRFDVVRP